MRATRLESALRRVDGRFRPSPRIVRRFVQHIILLQERERIATFLRRHVSPRVAASPPGQGLALGRLAKRQPLEARLARFTVTTPVHFPQERLRSVTWCRRTAQVTSRRQLARPRQGAAAPRRAAPAVELHSSSAQVYNVLVQSSWQATPAPIWKHESCSLATWAASPILSQSANSYRYA